MPYAPRAEDGDYGVDNQLAPMLVYVSKYSKANVRGKVTF